MSAKTQLFEGYFFIDQNSIDSNSKT